MSDLRINNITDRIGGSGPVIAGICTVTSTGAFTVPVGPTEMRGGRGRGIWGTGSQPSSINSIEYVEIATTGNATDFGDMTVAARGISACASSIRGLFVGGLNLTQLSYITISSSGGASHFGDLSYETFYPGCVSDNIRGVFAGGYEAPNQFYTKIEYSTFATLGNATDFGGELQHGNGYGGNRSGRTNMAGFSSPTRGIFAGGNQGYDYPASAPATDLIDYITIQTLGKVYDYGDLTSGRSGCAGASSSTRGVIAGGYTGTHFTPSLTVVNTIDYITIASIGNAIDFGDITQSRERFHGCSNGTRGVFAGGKTPTILNTIDYVTIATTGNASDFGDLITVRMEGAGCSDAHGGLG